MAQMAPDGLDEVDGGNGVDGVEGARWRRRRQKATPGIRDSPLVPNPHTKNGVAELVSVNQKADLGVFAKTKECFTQAWPNTLRNASAERKMTVGSKERWAF